MQVGDKIELKKDITLQYIDLYKYSDKTKGFIIIKKGTEGIISKIEGNECQVVFSIDGGYETKIPLTLPLKEFT